MSESFRLAKPEELDPQLIAEFFLHAFGEQKGTFLIEHRDWHYNQSEAQYFVVTDGGEIAGFNALIQSNCRVGGRALDCLWLVDIIVLPQFRGRGLQRLMDDKVRELGKLRLGYPNEVAAKIHLKHGWGVRHEAQKMTLPLSMHVSNRVRLSPKLIGQLARVVSEVVTPLIQGVFRLQHGNYKPAGARKVDVPDYENFARIFEQYQPAQPALTTHRTAQHLQWRFGDAPDTFDYYVVADGHEDKLVIITRRLHHKGIDTLRIMDIFGAIDRADLLGDGLKTVLRDATDSFPGQIQCVSSYPPLISVLEKLGFWIPQDIQFCWYSQDDDEMAQVANSASSWAFADSDLDAP